MCGIVAYLGNQKAYPILLKGLQRLEYRGYDSAGIALYDDGLVVYKKKGKVNDLIEHTADIPKVSTIGMGHTRWATHGEPNDINAHPHTSGNRRLSVVHNGIIENYGLLKEALIKQGHTFESDTDTEVLIHLIEEIQEQDQLSIAEAVRIALTRVVGAFAIVVMDRENPDQLIAARKASPLVIGIGENEYFLASDSTPIVEYTNQVIYLNDNEMATVTRDGYEIKTIDNEIQTPTIHQIDMKIERLEKGGYDSFMLKEIHEQPTTIADCMRGRMNQEEGFIRLRGIDECANRMLRANRFVIAACGTSWHAGLIGEYLFEELAKIPVEVEYASELRYRKPLLSSNDVVIAISQSGETADTLAALEMAKEHGALIYGIVNVVGSSIAR
ncbi:MAG: glutamine--fructose-6-phosphate transaminase (isomerizing), partial [Bacteroidota bacterium]